MKELGGRELAPITTSKGESRDLGKKIKIYLSSDIAKGSFTNMIDYIGKTGCKIAPAHL